jgi:hypothetical protein
MFISKGATSYVGEYFDSNTLSFNMREIRERGCIDDSRTAQLGIRPCDLVEITPVVCQASVAATIQVRMLAGTVS